MSEVSAVNFLYPCLSSSMFSSLAMASNKAFGFVVILCSAVVGNIVVSSGRTVVSLVFLDVP